MWRRCACGRIWRRLHAHSCRRTSRVAAVSNFSAGGTDIDAALRDVQQIVAAGAQEVDVVLPWRALLSGDAAAAEKLLRAVRQAVLGSAPEGDPGNRRTARGQIDPSRCTAGAGLRRRLPQDQHRQDGGRRHAAGRALAAASDRRRPAGAAACRPEGLGRHAARGRCVALPRSLCRRARHRCAAAGAPAHRRQQPARRHRGGARWHTRRGGNRRLTDAMLAQEIIRIKRDGGALDRMQIDAFVDGLVDGRWSEGQAAAMAMAMFSRGLSSAETIALTQAMTHSRRGAATGPRDQLRGPVLDKHSTGGVGDKVSLMLAPIVAACGGCRADDLRPRPGPHRRHARQARQHSRLPDRAGHRHAAHGAAPRPAAPSSARRPSWRRPTGGCMPSATSRRRSNRSR